ncbi:MAG TPA: carbohydrate porin [Kofleriaceae bacterium]|nr:carbohydrate porin [Kofleriaceae bacterium]
MANEQRKSQLRWCLAALTLLTLSVPRRSAAEGSDPSFKPSDNSVDAFFYGRIGFGYNQFGHSAAGAYMNLGDRRAIGGRLEEGDYLEPGLRYHVLKGGKDDTQVDLVFDFELFSDDGAILSDLSNDFKTLHFVPEQIYLQAHNVLQVKDLDIWIGGRLYRKNDIHIADYFYFNNLPAEGVGVMYKGLDAAVLIQSGSSPFYTADLGQGGPLPTGVTAAAKRLRTILVAEYQYPLGLRSSYVQGLGEVHFVPKSQNEVRAAPVGVNPSDYGLVGGVKVHLDLDHDNFSDTAIRYGNRIADGAASGRSTYDTFGLANGDGRYTGAYGIEFVEHFLFNFDKDLTINGYGTFDYNQGGSNVEPGVVGNNKRIDFAVGVRPVIYFTDQLRLLTEATFQGRKDDDLKMGTALKLSVAPTIAPSGKRGDFWARPEMRLIYTFAHYNNAAEDQLQSGFLKTFGPTQNAHFIGTRAEWWWY